MPKTCPHCDGRGTIRPPETRPLWARLFSANSTPVKCDFCRGIGRIPTPEDRDTRSQEEKRNAWRIASEKRAAEIEAQRSEELKRGSKGPIREARKPAQLESSRASALAASSEWARGYKERQLRERMAGKFRPNATAGISKNVADIGTDRVSVHRTVQCAECHGSGFFGKHDRRACYQCGGKGRFEWEQLLASIEIDDGRFVIKMRNQEEYDRRQAAIDGLDRVFGGDTPNDVQPDYVYGTLTQLSLEEIRKAVSFLLDTSTHLRFKGISVKGRHVAFVYEEDDGFSLYNLGGGHYGLKRKGDFGFRFKKS